MSAITSTPINAGADKSTPSGRLFFLDIGAGRVLSANPDGADLKTIINEGRKLPDELVDDVAAGHIYWTNLGNCKKNDGSIFRSDLDGKNMITLVPPGGTFTPTQLHLEKKSGKLYWSDREGMRVMRANLDGSKVETLVDTSHGEGDRRDPSNWCVGITVDPIRGQMYWTQKGADDSGHGRIFRASIDMPRGRTPTNRLDVEVLFEGLPEPIDLELDLAHRVLYWTDRGVPPRGNSVSRTPIDGLLTQQIVVGHLMEGIGIALDVRGDRMFVTDLAGSIYSAHLNGSERRPIAMAQGNLSGIAYAEKL